VDAKTQLQIMADYLGTIVVTVGESTPAAELLKCVPPATARTYQCFPVALNGNSLQLALADPFNSAHVDELGFVIKRDLQIVVAAPDSILRAVEKFYGQETASMSDVLKEIGDTGIADTDTDAADEAALAALADAAPIVRFVNMVLAQAVNDRASDIHFEPFEDEFKIRYRVDGVLYEMSPPPKSLALSVISRIKVMANLNISERRRTVVSPCRFLAAQWTCASRLCRRPLANPSCCVCWIARPSAWNWRRWVSRRTSTTTSPKSFNARTEFLSSPARPVAARRPRSTRACAG
jgi:type IV pilus assembly protein PilB